LQSFVNFRSPWIDAHAFEMALPRSNSPHDPAVTEVYFTVSNGCKLLLVPILRLLSLVNQLAFEGKYILLRFEDGVTGAIGYLNRIGFFDHLFDSVQIVPARPSFSGARRYAGGNSGVVEIAAISRDRVDDELPKRLASTIRSNCGARDDADKLEISAWTIFSELIGNIIDHSEGQIDGYAALQVYASGKVHVAVSDSGVGIMDTLRPSL
jgi:hypothetical protein